MLLCESSIAALYTDYKQGGTRHVQVRSALEQERLAVPPDSEYAREIEHALKCLDDVFAAGLESDSHFDGVLQRFGRSRM